MGNNESRVYQGPVGYVGEGGQPVLTQEQVEGMQLYPMDPDLWGVAAAIVADFKRYDGERFAPVPDTYEYGGQQVPNAVTVLVSNMRALEAIVDLAGRSEPLADFAQMLWDTGRVEDPRWLEVAKPWMVRAAYYNPTTVCSVVLTKTGYAATLADSE